MQLKYRLCVLMLSNVLLIKAAEVYSEPLTIFTKRSVLNVCQGPEYSSDQLMQCFQGST